MADFNEELDIGNKVDKFCFLADVHNADVVSPQ